LKGHKHTERFKAKVTLAAIDQRAHDGNRGYLPVRALCVEQDVILADEFGDANLPAGSGNRRVVEKALAALPRGIDKICLRGDSALYEHE
jgi:hypothetical protein